jgi:hypothetical protein
MALKVVSMHELKLEVLLEPARTLYVHPVTR